jgi:DNA-binding beta-propeller fold protein YncE
MKRMLFLMCTLAAMAAGAAERHLLYVAEPGIRNYLEYGGHGVLVFDMDNGFAFVKRIPLGGLDDKGTPRNVKGVCANGRTGRLYVSTTHTLQCLDLVTDKLLWERAYEGGCDRMSMTPDGKEIYQPSFEKDHWHVLDAMTGDVLQRIDTPSGAHNTVVSPDGTFAFLAGLRSPLLRVVDTKTRAIVKEIGPFTDAIRPFAVNHDGSLCFVNVNGLLGFEIGDLKTGRMLHRVEVAGFETGAVKRHGCPSHGIGMTPDEKEIWVSDGHNQMLHVFDATALPPRQRDSIKLRDDPGWITFSIDGRFAWPSSGDVIDVATHKILTTLEDEQGRHVQSEKLLEIDFEEGRPVRAGDQFGIGRGK